MKKKYEIITDKEYRADMVQLAMGTVAVLIIFCLGVLFISKLVS